jgi:hypothetical protein
MAAGTTYAILITALIFYGFYAAATEGIAKAWISNIVDRKDVATAIGTFTGFQSICTLMASSITGFIWWQLGALPALLFSALGALVVVIYLFFAVKAPIIEH